MRTYRSEKKSYNGAKKECPFDAIICRVDGGFLCFESPADYKIWKSQR